MALEQVAMSNWVSPDKVVLMTGIAWIIVVLALIGVGVFLLIYFLRYKHRVEIWELKSNGVKVLTDRARRIVRNRILTEYSLLKAKISIPPPTTECIYMDKKGREVIKLFRDTQGNITYIPFKPGAIEFGTISTDMALYNILKHKQINTDYAAKTFWEKYGLTISILLVFACMFVGFIVISGEMTKTAGALTSAANVLRDAIAQSQTQVIR